MKNCYINEGSHYALSEMETKIGRGRHISYRCFVCEPTSKVYRMPETERVVYGEYAGNSTWHDQKHFDVSWSEQQHYLGRVV